MNCILMAILSLILYDVQSLKAPKEKVAQMVHEIDSNTTPITKLCFLCLGGTASTAECMVRGIQDDNVSCAEGYCVGTSLNCTVCPAGTFSDGVNRLGVSECTNCSEGYYSLLNRSTSCTDCEVRFYCPYSRNPVEISCPIGWFCNLTQMSVPFPCPKGTYCPKIEMKNPMICPAGRFCLGGSEPPIPCPENTRCPPGTSFPINCPSLFISDKMSAECSPTIAFWVIAAISIISIFIFFWLAIFQNFQYGYDRARRNQIK